MKPLSFFSVLLAASGINATVTNLPTKDVKCSGVSRAFKPSDIENAGNAAIQHKDSPIGARKYPHRYYFDRPDCPGDLYGFPLSWTIAYTGGDPGLVRGIFTFQKVGNTWQARYCGTYAHKTKPGDNNFYICN
ncbi:hypothetical protein N5P37_006346 [Trichoderma harzianum]|uniref:Uncharacterized protein n=1 Tax=Trichoderma harzianum CBS 226.95 TaxID=983964 RepID=A0A2T4A9R0_TRIHA|nr:hypothetical protein M431DRAFT_520729 [Trichoderma harzianum CBS 226.95]KAK0761396.1 hypothetical protein N5P37_006346 [Trichoderma harzianum]PKK45426.1 hypothetical protein CI102_9814 [Trichoderma harzianum]PTB53786.1 hypothetical protein M431DRAFT_520729 [Trichoderma harzianum CBS 226.95]